MSDLHNRILSLECNVPPDANINQVISFRYGHRQAQHEAAAIALEADSEIERLRARVGKLKWLPIETAPKDGTEILAFREDAGQFIARWIAPASFLSSRELDRIDSEVAEQEDWYCADFVCGGRLDGDLAPTHWMQLPPPPAV